MKQSLHAKKYGKYTDEEIEAVIGTMTLGIVIGAWVIFMLMLGRV
jgi:hypothetical protein